MLELVDRSQSEPLGDGELIAEVRNLYISEAEPLGTVPAPGTAKGVLKTGAQMLTGKRPQVLIDKLAERLAFERGGARLYDGVIAKCTSVGTGAEGISIDALREIREEEVAHFELLTECLELLGADPTAQTPSADAVGVETMGLLQLVSDPRSSVAHSLHAALNAELSDVAGWAILIALADEFGQKDIANRFRKAEETETRHLARVRSWYERLTLDAAKLG
jgi:bacterioferritin (cytochrome b1)